MGGKSQPKAPDYTPMANASEAAAQLGAEAQANQLAFSREQWEFNKSEYAKYSPILQQIYGAQLDSMNEQMAMARDAYDYQKNTFRPIQDRLIREAEQYNTDAYREQLAQQAKADTERAFSAQDEARTREMLSMGVNPNSGRFQGLARTQDTQQAAMQAAAMNNTRYQARDKGRGLLGAALASGQNQAGLALNAYAGALNAGNAAGANSMAAGNNYMAGLNSAAGLAAQGYGLGFQGRSLQMQGLGQIMNSQTSIYGDNMAANAAMMQGLGQAAGMIGGAMFMSDRKVKDDIREVGTYPNGFTMYEFRYKGDDSRTKWRGVMADEVELVDPLAVETVNGIKVVNYSRLGIRPEVV